MKTDGKKLILPGDTRGRWGNPTNLEILKPSTVATYHRILRIMFNWIVEEGAYQSSPMRNISPPIDRRDQVQPFTQEQVDSIVKAAENSDYPARNLALVRLLLDTGARVSEIASIKIEQLEMARRCVRVLGKGAKMRDLYFGKKASQHIWRYIRQRRPDTVQTWDSGEPLFLSERTHEGLTRSGIQQIISRLGDNAGITTARCSPHTFRHTFAINFLKNGGNQFALMHLLGHTNLKQTEVYVQYAQADTEDQHRRFSPGDRM